MSSIEKYMRRALLVLAFCLTMGNPARADLLFSNLGQPDGGATGFNSLNELKASDFLTDATPRTITNITVRLANSSQALTLDLLLSIYLDDGSGIPGTQLQAFDTPIAVPANSSGDYTATSAGINLQANTRYWVVGQAIDEDFGGTLTWHFSNGEGTDGGPYSTVSSTEMQRSSTGGLLWIPDDPGNFIFALHGNAPVPEPGTSALLALGAAAIAGRGWHRRRANRG